MWFRDESEPFKYTGVPFRSGLEAAVAKNLDDMGVEWAYERGVEGVNKYLPDFTILESLTAMQFPQWIEVKPPELLYAVRDHLGIPERFVDDVRADITAQQIYDAGLSEIWKPKALAEHQHEAVLVVSKINRNRTLSIEMYPEHVVLSKRHPGVNWREVKKEEERQRRQAQWRAEAAERAAERAREDEQRRADNLAWAMSVDSRPARYDGWCIVCSAHKPACDLLIARHDDRWLAFCSAHGNGR